MEKHEALPQFTYHPDPVGTGVIVPSDSVCNVCGRQTGFVYTGAMHGENAKQLRGALCPWCIADGSAHERFGVEFASDVGFLGDRVSADVPMSVFEEIAYRTPAFISWQVERWWTHCWDAAEFLGYAGKKELSGEWADAVDVIRADYLSVGVGDWNFMFDWLHREGDAIAYVFRCRHCGKLGGYCDSN